jgi:DNA-directed RNA polymerase subunit H (RpoH/RPB5)
MVKKDISISITKHVLVPKHEKLTKEMEKELLTKLKIKKEHLPRIRKEDPALRSLDVKIDDIIRIERKSQTSGLSYFYRVVSNE